MSTTIDVICYRYRPLKNNELPLKLRLTKDRKRHYLNLEISVKSEHWDFEKNKPKRNCPDKDHIQNVILERKNQYQKQVLEFQSMGKDYSLNQLVNAVEKPTKDITVDIFINDIINGLISENKIGNANHYRALLYSLRKYIKLSQLMFIDIDTNFLNKYETHLKSLGNKGNTISIKMRTLKAVYNKAVKDNIIKQEYSPFSGYSVSKLKEDTVKRSITKDEILKIIDFDVNRISKRPQSLLQFSKDLFLFSYFGCGINMIDIAYLKIENIQDNRVIYKRHKTGKAISFSLQTYVIDIICKYEDVNSNYLFPILDDSVHITVEQQIRRIKKVTYVVNKNLKQIGNVMNLKIPLTTYMARHTNFHYRLKDSVLQDTFS
ncbi:phage integrase SAM-like domain-containing protein [Dysgonomonas sp.]